MSRSLTENKLNLVFFVNNTGLYVDRREHLFSHSIWNNVRHSFHVYPSEMVHFLQWRMDDWWHQSTHDKVRPPHHTNIYGAGYTKRRRMGWGVLTPNMPVDRSLQFWKKKSLISHFVLMLHLYFKQQTREEPDKFWMCFLILIPICCTVYRS